MSDSTPFDPFNTRDTFDSGSGDVGIYRLSRLQEQGIGDIGKLPYSIRVLLESVLRNCDGYVVEQEDVRNLANWNAAAVSYTHLTLPTKRIV